MSAQHELRMAWGVVEIESKEVLNDLEVCPAGVAAPGGEILVGIDRHGLRHLLIEVEDVAAVRADQHSRGVLVEPREVAGGRSYADVVCLIKKLNPIFEYLAGDICTRVSAGEDRLRSIYSTLEDWRDLLLPNESSRLGSNQLAGLLGELLTLERIVSLDPQRRLDVWAGPASDRHDFHRAATAIEVKVTTRTQGLFVEIHGDRQLEPPEGGSLALAVLKLERADTGDSCLDVFERLTQLGCSATDLTSLMQAAGLDLRERDFYETFRFGIVEDHIYDVGSDFPRIVPASFKAGQTPAGVLDVRYSLDLSGSQPAPLSGDAAEGLLKEIANAS